MRFFKNTFYPRAAKLAITLAFIFNMNFAAASDTNPYLIEDVAVNVVGKNPSDARNIAVKTARRDAFLILLARISTDAKIADRVSDDDISEMVRSEQISDEKISQTSYSANFTIYFAKDFVEHILAQKNVKTDKKIVEVQEAGGAYLVVSPKVLKRKVLLWEESNDWRLAMEKAVKDIADDNARLPAGDIDDMAILNADTVNQITYGELEPLFSKYKADMIYITAFSFDGVTNKASVTIRGFGKLRKTQTKLNFANSNNLTEDDLIDKISTKAAEHLSNISRGKSLKPAEDAVIELMIPVSKLGDWLMIKSRLERSNLISKMNIEAISHDMVKIAVCYNDTGMDLFEAFDRAGFVLTKNNDETYLLILK